MRSVRGCIARFAAPLGAYCNVVAFLLSSCLPPSLRFGRLPPARKRSGGFGFFFVVFFVGVVVEFLHVLCCTPAGCALAALHYFPCGSCPPAGPFTFFLLAPRPPPRTRFPRPPPAVCALRGAGSRRAMRRVGKLLWVFASGLLYCTHRARKQ